MLVSDIRVASSRYSCELQAQVKGKGLRKPFRLRYLSPLAFERFIDPDNGDPFFAATLLLAKKNHEPLQINDPVSSRLMQSIDKIQAVYTHWNSELAHVKVDAPAKHGSFDGLYRGSFISCGVDSFYTLFKNVAG